MSESDSKAHLEEDLCIHIFTASAALLGVCLTVIGIIRLVITTRNVNTVADDLLVIDAFVFLCACLVSYSALRTRKKRRAYRIENMADALFLFGLLLMVMICATIAYALA